MGKSLIINITALYLKKQKTEAAFQIRVLQGEKL